MQKETPFRYRDGEQKTVCGNCGYIQTETASLTTEEYFNNFAINPPVAQADTSHRSGFTIRPISHQTV